MCYQLFLCYCCKPAVIKAYEDPYCLPLTDGHVRATVAHACVCKKSMRACCLHANSVCLCELACLHC